MRYRAKGAVGICLSFSPGVDAVYFHYHRAGTFPAGGVISAIGQGADGVEQI